MILPTELAPVEAERLTVQQRLDGKKHKAERNRLGQFATPPALAASVIRAACSLMPDSRGIRFLEPAIGTGAFFSALLAQAPPRRIEHALGFEIDAEFAAAARTLWERAPLQVNTEDFTRAAIPASEREKPNLLICNPPYVRHHHLTAEDKARLRSAAFAAAGVNLSGLTGLYCYFLALAHRWMAPDAVAVWLIPSEFMGVNYGAEIRRYLRERVTLERIHRFDPSEVQFGDALVSSAVVFLTNRQPPAEHCVRFTFGGSLEQPKREVAVSLAALNPRDKWLAFPRAEDARPCSPDENTVTIADVFDIRRGIATGSNEFFILTEQQAREMELPECFLRPILPSPRNVPTDHVSADANGVPNIVGRLLLLSCDLPEAEIQSRYPSLWRYLQSGVAAGISARYLCASREPWYSQEVRKPAPFLCSYIGRYESRAGKPFRFLLNESAAIATNSWLMLYPKGVLAEALKAAPERQLAVSDALNRISSETLVAVGRVYGGGLHKLEPKELAKAPAAEVLAAAACDRSPSKQLAFFEQPGDYRARTKKKAMSVSGGRL